MMPDLPISLLPYVGNTGYTNNDLLVIVNYLLPSGTTSNTTVSQHKDWILSGLTTSFLPLSGGTVTGDVIFQNAITANTISATTISGGTFFGDGSGLTNTPNIYNTNGALTANRILDLSGRTLSFQRSSNQNDSLLTGLDSSGNTLFEIRGKVFSSQTFYDGEVSLFFGRGSGSNISTGAALAGVRNVGFGDYVMTATTTGGYNVGVGTYALRDNIGGNFNVVVGDGAARSFKSGDDNTIIGQNAAANITGGTDNVFVGNNIKDIGSTVGVGNTVVGSWAGRTFTGDNNTVIGRYAGRTATFGSGNVFLGAFAGRFEAGSNYLYIDNSSTTTPLIYGDFSNDLLRFNAKVGVNVQPNTYQFDVNGTGRFTNDLYADSNIIINTNYTINTTSTSIPYYVGIWRRDGTPYGTFFMETEQGGPKDKWAFVRRDGYGQVRELYTGNSSIININLGWTNANTDFWDGNTLLIDPVINITNGLQTTIRGIYYNPTLSGTSGVTHIAYQNTTGNNILNSISGNTLIGTTTDSGNKLYVSATTNPVRFVGLQSGNTDTRILTSDSNGVIRYRNFSDFSGGTGGEVNTASNLGTGTGLFAQKSGVDLQFKSLTSTGGTVTISNNSTTVNLEVVPASNFTGGTVTGDTIFQSGLTANTISATTISGGTFYGDGSGLTNIVTSVNAGSGLSGNSTTGNITLVNTAPDQTVTISGGTGILTGGTYPNFTITNTAPDQTVTISGGTNIQIAGSYPNFGVNYTGQTSFPYLPLSGGTVTGNTIFTTGLTAQTLFVSATTNPVQFQNLQFNSTDTRILTSDSNGVIRYTNLNNITGLTSADTFTTAFTYNNNTFTLNDNSGRTFNAVINTVTGFTINGNLTVTGNTSLQNLTGRTAVFSSSSQNILTVIGSGNSTTSPLFSVVGSQGELFSITDSLVGSLFSVNDISGLPILEVFSDERILMGSYLAPSLNTTKRLTLTAGTNTVYQIPTSAYTGGFFDYTLMSTGATGARSGSIISIWSGTTTRFNEVTTLDIGSTTGVTFNVDISGANAVLSASASTSGWTLKTIIRSI